METKQFSFDLLEEAEVTLLVDSNSRALNAYHAKQEPGNFLLELMPSSHVMPADGRIIDPTATKYIATRVVDEIFEKYEGSNLKIIADDRGSRRYWQFRFKE